MAGAEGASGEAGLATESVMACFCLMGANGVATLGVAAAGRSLGTNGVVVVGCFGDEGGEAGCVEGFGGGEASGVGVGVGVRCGVSAGFVVGCLRVSGSFVFSGLAVMGSFGGGRPRPSGARTRAARLWCWWGGSGRVASSGPAATASSAMWVADAVSGTTDSTADGRGSARTRAADATASERSVDGRMVTV